MAQRLDPGFGKAASRHDELKVGFDGAFGQNHVSPRGLTSKVRSYANKNHTHAREEADGGRDGRREEGNIINVLGDTEMHLVCLLFVLPTH